MRFIDIEIVRSDGSGFIVGHDDVLMNDCRVPSGAVTDIPLVIDGANYRGFGLQIGGNIELRDLADGGYLMGVIDGNVTFTSGAENNDLPNALITETMTDNGTGNSY